MIKVWTNKSGAKTTAKLETEYSYDNSDHITLQQTNSLVDHNMWAAYNYDSRGRVINIHSRQQFNDGEALGIEETLFREQIGYDSNNNIHNVTITNVGAGTWQPLNFTYEYDGLNRLTLSDYSPGDTYSSLFEYDKDGNLTQKFRYDKNINYVYEGNTNKLDYIYYNGPDRQFTCDYRGNMIYDGLKDITIAKYDRRNLPLQMTLGADNFYYNYDDGGNRINKKAGTTNEYYLRDHTGRELLVYDNNTGRLKMANIFGNGLVGRVDIDWQLVRVWDWEIAHWVFQWVRTDNRFYYLKDHLGSIRMTVNSAGAVVGYDDYYPFGKIMPNRSYVSSADYRFRFTSKERDVETGYDYFGARYYDSKIGRWLQVDPLADIYPGWSPYNYTLNNPLKYVDPDGSYVKNKNRYGQTYYQQWTVNGAFAQLHKENRGDGSIVSKRLIRGDRSFNVQSWETMYGIPYAIVGGFETLINGIGIFAPLLGVDRIRQFLTSSESNMLSLDEAIFNAVNNEYIEGIKLSKYDEDNHILELSDEMREQLKAEGNTDDQINNKWELQFERIQDDAVRNFEFNTSWDRVYDASNQ